MHRPHATLVDANRLPVRILRCARAGLWPWWHLRRCRPTGWLLYANDIDGASITHQGRRYPLRGGQSLLFPPGIEYDTTPGPDTHQLYVDFDVPGMPSDMPSEPTALGDDPVLRAITDELHRLLVFGHNHYDPTIVNLAHAWIRLAMARAMARLPEAVRAAWAERGSDPLERAVAAIEHGLGKPQYIAELAGRCGMGPQWFSKRFRARFGKSPAQYLLDRRIAVAAQRLVHDEVDVDHVAESCGFTDRSHFTRAFTKRMGQPPGRYRDEARKRFRGE